ncbi:MAG: hypothetical protein K6G45_08095 [Lachnospiraceae bacterium]|nr:hypothetical protein [Lachnospiraceae bacterium]
MKRVSKVLSLLLALVLIVSATGTIPAKADNTLLMAVESQPYFLVVPGQTTHVTIPVKVAGGHDVQISSIMAVCENDCLKVENLKLKFTGSDKEIDLSELNSYSSPNNAYVYSITNNGLRLAYNERKPVVYFDFDIIADDELKIGYDTINIVGTGFEIDETANFVNQKIDLLNVSTYNSKEKSPAYLSISSIDYIKDNMVPGKSTSIVFTVKNEGEIRILNSYMVLDFGDTGIIPDYSVEKIKIGDLAAGATKNVTANIKLLDSAKTGLQGITASFGGKSRTGSEVGPFIQSVYVTIKGNVSENKDKSPSLSLTTEDNYGELKRGEKMTIPVKIKNDGSAAAKSVTISITEGVGPTMGITKDYTSNEMSVGDIAAGKTATVKIPITVSEDVAAGLHEFAFEVKYKDSDGIEKAPVTMSMYLEAKPKPEEDKKPDLYNYIDIHNVSQSPSAPESGGKVSVSFEITNNGNGAVKNLRVYGMSLSSSGFEPITNEPYQKVGDIAAGSSKKTSMVFKVGENITSGTNTLTIGYEYIDENGDKKTDSASLYILNIVGKKDEQSKDVGRPKLIISDYATDNTILKAGETFDFSFSIKNTHQTKAAKNIKITISQMEGVFSPAAGTNIFYVDSIAAGQVSVQTINLKTRADAVTGDYDLMIRLEYEYDDMSDTDREKGGVSEDNTIKLRATENYRPVIENISLDAWQGCYVGVPVDMNFEFYNMGKSTLGNVYITVEGDFALANNSQMSYVGAIQGYGQEFINPQVVALVEGDATGILTVHFEDSNGDEVTLSQEFTQFVQSMGGGEGGEYGEYGEFDPGTIDPNYDPGMYDDPGFDPNGMGDEDGGFFSKIKLWMWIAGGCVVAAAVAVPLIIHGVKKSKKVKVDEDEDY